MRKGVIYKTSSAKLNIINGMEAAPLCAIIPDATMLSLRERARKHFLCAVANKKPEVVANLAESVLPLYQPLYEIIAWTDDEQERDILIKKFFPNDLRTDSNRYQALSFISTLYDRMTYWWASKLQFSNKSGELDYKFEQMLSKWKPIVPYQKSSLSKGESLLLFIDSLLEETSSFRFYAPILEGKSINEKPENTASFPSQLY